MIIIGYQGIGKSTVSNRKSGFIDLESGNFWVDGKRDSNWHIPYCNIATHLSEQGYNVFTSSHEVVRKQLKKSNQQKIIVCPSLELKDIWLKRLTKRYEETMSDKDYKAMMNAVDRYDENIKELLNEDGFEKVIISTVPYDLILEIKQLNQ